MLEEESGHLDLDQAEGEMIELVRALGAEGLGRWAQAKEEEAHTRERQKGGRRLHDKKDELFQSAGPG